MNKMKIQFDRPHTQISFANSLLEIRKLYLQDALSSTVELVKISEIDFELHKFTDDKSLRILAKHGMRGELLFATPCILSCNPYILGYYRLLLGYSQKGFYTSASGAAVFKSMEEKGSLSEKQKSLLPELCIVLNENARFMLDNLSPEMIDPAFFNHLTLLTLGPQLRGGANVQKGTTAIVQVFNLLYQIVEKAVLSTDSHTILIKNNSNRTVHIQFAADPDIVLREELAPGIFKNLIAIEVKGGRDYSNIHNRIGEAEKSHQKARENGYVECWTVVNVDRIDLSMAHRESPTTNTFFRLTDLLDKGSSSYKSFALQIMSAVGI